MSVRINSDTDRLERALWAGASADLANPYTISFWFNLINDRGVNSSLFGLGSGGTDYLAQTDPNGLDLKIWNGGGYSAAHYTLATAAWRNLAFVRDAAGGGSTIWIDGVSRVTDSNFNTLTGILLTLGYDQFGGDWTDVELCDARVWQVAQTGAQIASEIASPTPVMASPYLVLRLASAATAATDSSGNGRSATVSGLTDGTTEPAIYSGGGGASSFPPVPAPPNPYLSLLAQ